MFKWGVISRSDGFRLGEGADFHHPEASGLMRITKL